MPTITETFDLLRGRFARCRKRRPYEEVAKEIGVSHPVLNRFAAWGEPIGEKQALLIERWCMQQEQAVVHG